MYQLSSQRLKMIFACYAALYGHALNKTQTYQLIANQLNKQIKSSRDWTLSYVAQVVRNNLDPSEDFSRAINSLFVQVQATPGSPKLVEITVFAPAGIIEPNTVLSVPSRRCAVCNIAFIPHTHNHIYCSVICKTIAKKSRRKKC